MKYILAHEQLETYRLALRFAGLAVPLLDYWPSSVAVRGQLDRAIESLMTNLVKAAHWQRTERGIYLLECSLGSVLECAACLDVAQLRRLIDHDRLHAWKQMLQKVARMQVGLRGSWSGSMSMAEEAEAYGTEEQTYFDHEKLKVYQWSLHLHEVLWLVISGEMKEHRYVRRIDELSTSITLNIAEGNGRFSRCDHRNFVSNAENAGAGLSAYLDIAQAGWSTDVETAKMLLREIMAMLGGLEESLREDK